MAFMRMPGFIGKAKDGLTKKKIREELLSYKKLLDEQILTQEEFDLKADELKKILLAKEVETESAQPKSEEVSNIENKDISGVQPVNTADDKFYEQAIIEVEENKHHKPSWAKAFSEAEGDEAKTKALYIKIRAVHLQEEERRRNDEEERRRDEEEKEKRWDEERRKKYLIEQEVKKQKKLAPIQEVIDLYVKESYSFKYGEELDDLVKRKTEIKCLQCGKRIYGISSFCNESHRKAFFNTIDKYIDR